MRIREDTKKRALRFFPHLGLLIVIGFIVFYYPRPTAETPIVNQDVDTTQQDQGVNADNSIKNFEVLKQFTDDEFKQLYNSLALPNIVPIIEAPYITGNALADTHIQLLAEIRGYRLRDVASSQLNNIDDFPVQELLIQDWYQLEASAQEDSIQLNFVSGYRSIEEQRDLFVQSLVSAGITVSQIIDESADDAINNILRTISPPGYSRHHSGYTIDVADPGFAVFAFSDGYAWLSANNFEKAKEHGFIPSYPGATLQGPDPEPWEFVWVGKHLTYE